MLEVMGVFKSFEQAGVHIDVLRGVDLSVREGESVAIVGESGSGKSTLMALLAGLDRPDRGSIRYNGRAIESLGENELSKYRAEQVGIVFQQFHLMPDLTALENVALPIELSEGSDAYGRARELLSAVGLKDRAGHFARQLSGGECQRVALARALARRPKILLADEPTGNLDNATAGPVADLIFSLAEKEGSILIVVTHSEEIARRCLRVTRLRHGILE